MQDLATRIILSISYSLSGMDSMVLLLEELTRAARYDDVLAT